MGNTDRWAGGQHIEWHERPTLRDPVLLIAFEGWNDAGDAATGAAEFFLDTWSARPLAEIDPEEFFDFTTTRPHVEFDDDGHRQVRWPSNTMHVATVPGQDRDIVILRGVEPQLRWKSFCAQIVHVVRELHIDLAVTLGALLAEVPHSRPVSVLGTAYEEEIIAELDLSPSHYEGPTGIIGVLHTALRDAGVKSASLWAAVPTYVPGAPSPKAAMALVERTATLLEAEVVTDELQIASASYDREVSKLVEEDDETAEYVASLEARYDNDRIDVTTSDSLVEEVENFLRERRN